MTASITQDKVTQRRMITMEVNTETAASLALVLSKVSDVTRNEGLDRLAEALDLLGIVPVGSITVEEDIFDNESDEPFNIVVGD
jgi:hypothetical protein